MARIESFYKVMVDQLASDTHRGAVSCHNFPILLTVPSNSGKSTMTAIKTALGNRPTTRDVITLEFTHEPVNCVISQLKNGTHSESFASGLRSALREDHDVIPSHEAARSHSHSAQSVSP